MERRNPIKMTLFVALLFFATSAYADDKKDPKLELLGAPVQVLIPGGGGSGYAYEYKNGKTYILTCYHVIDNYVTGGATDMKVRHQIVNERGFPVKVGFFKASVVFHDEKSDLAVISVNKKLPGTREIKFDGVEERIKVFDEVVTLGSPFKMPNVPTEGQLSSIMWDNDIGIVFLAQTLTAPGGSGGPAFVKDGESWKFLGIVYAVQAMQGHQSGFVMIIPVSKVGEFFEEMNSEEKAEETVEQDK